MQAQSTSTVVSYSDFDPSDLPGILKTRFPSASLSPFGPDSLDALAGSSVPVSAVQQGNLKVSDLSDVMSGQAASSLAEQFNNRGLQFKDGQAFSKVVGLLESAQTQQEIDAVLSMARQAMTASAPAASQTIADKLPPGTVDGSRGWSLADFSSSGVSNRQAGELASLLNSGAVQFDDPAELGAYLARLSNNPALTPLSDRSLKPGLFASIRPLWRPDMSTGAGQLLSGLLRASAPNEPIPQAKIPAADFVKAGLPQAEADQLAQAHNLKRKILTPEAVAEILATGQAAPVLARLADGSGAQKSATKLSKTNNFLDSLNAAPVKSGTYPTAKAFAAKVNSDPNLQAMVNNALGSYVRNTLSSPLWKAIEDGKVDVSDQKGLNRLASSLRDARDKGIPTSVAASIIAQTGKLDTSDIPEVTTDVVSDDRFQPKNKSLLQSSSFVPLFSPVSVYQNHAPSPGVPRPNGIATPKVAPQTAAEWDALQSQVDKVRQSDVMTNAEWHYRGADARNLAAVAKIQGYDGLPEVVDAATLSSKLLQGGVEGFRSVDDINGITGAGLLHQLKHGAYFAGNGIFGDGTYMAVANEDSGHTRDDSLEDSGTYGETTARLMLKDGARVIDFNGLKQVRDEDRKRYMQEKGIDDYQDLPNLLKNGYEGAYAAAKGYDGIRNNSNYVNVLNRTALAVQKELYVG